MSTKIFLPAFCLVGTAFLLAPLAPSRAFTKIGGKLSENQRDVRVFNNFADPTANDNTTSPAQFPGWDGAELASWKAIVEWGSRLHGDGTGDPLNGNQLGSGGANFDAFWAGSAAAIGSTDNNVISTIPTCPNGVLAFTETPISNGWRIRVCDNAWVWDDGPGSVASRWDLQSVITHEYGHALGLGHSAVSSATMFPSGSPGQTSLRSIAPDDIAGIQCIYGIASATKPTIVATVASAGTMTVYGTNFGATGNEVWFTNAAVTLAAVDPIVRVANVASTNGGTVVSCAIPADARAGDVIVRKPGTGGAVLSNAFPTDLVGTFGTPPNPHPDITGVSPSSIDALIPGTAQAITISGTNLDRTTSLLLDAVPIATSRYTIVDPATITLDMPQASSLGAHTLSASDGSTTDDFAVTIVVPATPQLELGTGDPGNVIDRDNGLSFVLSGNVGSVYRVYGSLSNLPSSNAYVSLGIGNNFSSVMYGGTFTIPASGWLQVSIPASAIPDPVVRGSSGSGARARASKGTTFYSQAIALEFPAPLPVSNVQQIFMAR